MLIIYIHNILYIFLPVVPEMIWFTTDFCYIMGYTYYKECHKMTREKLLNQIAAYIPYNEQETADRELILHWIQDHDDAFTRQNQVAHITASAWVVNRDRRKVLLVYHNIYNSWSWLGGHADGETDLLAVALREVKEEAGIANVRPVSPDIYSLESLTVDGHVKKGQYVSSHLHLNVTYLLRPTPMRPYP